MNKEEWDCTVCVHKMCVSQSLLIYILILAKPTTLNEMILICTLTYELTQLLSKIYISLKLSECSLLSLDYIWFEFTAFSNSSEIVKAKLRSYLKLTTGAWVFAYPVTDLGLFDVFLGALVEPRWANCSTGLGLSNNLRVVRFFAKCLPACVCLCSWSNVASKGMWQLLVPAKGRSSSEPLWRLFAPQSVLHHTRKEGRKGIWHKGWWDLTASKCVLCLCDYIFYSQYTKEMQVQLWSLLFNWLWAQYLFTGLFKSGQPRLSINATSRACH